MVEETERAKQRKATGQAKPGDKLAAKNGAVRPDRTVKPGSEAGYTRTVLAKKYGAPEKAVRLAMKEVKAEAVRTPTEAEAGRGARASARCRPDRARGREAPQPREQHHGRGGCT